MIRKPVKNIRHNWKERLEEAGFYFYEMDGMLYWDESVFYDFTSDDVDCIEAATDELYELCLSLVSHVITHNLYEKIGIPPKYSALIKQSWDGRQPSIYGRFDLWYDGKSEPKLLEFNADTPTALFEASVIQYYWLQDYKPEKDQFNSIHEKLLEVMENHIKRYAKQKTLYFASVKDSIEDYTTVQYIRDLAMQAGINTRHIFIDDVGYDFNKKVFVDLDNNPIMLMFKLYPWEWIIREDFSRYLSSSGIIFFEPAWKMILSNKAILPLLWEMYPNHKNLLPAFFEPPNNGEHYVEKPFFSREGENIRTGSSFFRSRNNVIYQEFKELPNFSGNFPVIGSWVIGSEPAGMGIREDTTPITNNMSRFVPHMF